MASPPTMDPVSRSASEAGIEHDRRVLRIVAPILAVAHAVALVTLPRWPSRPAVVAWLSGLELLHGLALPFALGLSVLAWGRPRRWLGDAATLFYGPLGAALVANAQQHHGRMLALMLALLGTATLLRVRPSVRTAADASSLALALAGIARLQPDLALRRVNMAAACAIVALAWGIARVLRASLVRETRMRLSLEDGQRRLAAQLDEQREETQARVREVHRLNADLAVRVRARSVELAVALDRLSSAPGVAVLGPGTVVGERVEIVEPLGVGGMGVVYRGVDRATGREVAIKLLQAIDATEIDAFRRFLREAEAASSIQHPAIVRVLHVDVSADGRLFQILELVEGESLANRLAKLGRLDWRLTARIGEVTASALVAAHAAGIVHRDVKPSNIMLTPTPPSLKLLDFGASLLRDGGSANLTRPGLVIGTPEYLAPEQIVDSATVDGRADVYALGLVLYRCVSGKSPFQAGTVMGWIHAHALSRPSTLSGEAPSALTTLLARCLQKRAADRPSMHEVQQALATLADREGVPPLYELEREFSGLRRSSGRGSQRDSA